jgi:hypothetical protein
MMEAKYLWIAGSIIITALGMIHLVYTFCTNKLSPRNKELKEAMKMASPMITKQTTIWKAWTGFNASHSIGMIFLGFINLYFAANYFSIFKSENTYFVLNIFTVAFYLWLARKYWFKIPFTGIGISFLCYFISYLLIVINK